MRLELELMLSFYRPVVSQKGLDSLVILLGGVDGVQDMLVALNKRAVVHFGDEIDGAVGVVTRETTADDAVLSFQALVEPGAAGGIQQANHGGDNTAILDKINLVFED